MEHAVKDVRSHNSGAELSVCIAVSSFHGSVALAHREEVVVAEFELGETKDQASGSRAVVSTTCVFPTSQIVRCLTFLPSQQPLLVAAGDSKLVTLFNLRSSVKLEASFGPMEKRIVGIEPLSARAVLVASKFGEIFMLNLVRHEGAGLSWEPQQAFCLSHLAVPTAMAVIPSLAAQPARLVSADKNAHVRVSNLPDSFCIKEFIWGPAPQSPVVRLLILQNAASTFIFAGCLDGRVNLFKFDPLKSTKLLHSWSFPESKCVVGLAFLRPESIEQQVDSGGLAVAHESYTSLSFIPILLEHSSAGEVQVSKVAAQVVLPSSVPPLALEGWCAIGTGSSEKAVVLQRNGCLHWVELAIFPKNNIVMHEMDNSNLHASVQLWESGLRNIDVTSLWRCEAAHGGRGEDSASDVDEEDAPLKKMRVEAPAV